MYELLARGILEERDDRITHEEVDAYVAGYVERRQEVWDFVQKCQGRLAALPQPLLKLMHAYHLWDGYKGGRWREFLGRFVGGTSKREMQEMGFKVPRGFSYALVVPYYDVPGRVTSVLLLGRDGRSRRIYTSPEGASQEGGLMMLETLNLHDELVMAIGNPLIALQLQRKHFNSSARPLPIVSYDVSTRRAWQSVQARRVVFWDVEKVYDVFDQARQHPRGHVASYPKLRNRTARTYFVEHPLPDTYTLFRESALPWAEALKRYILKGESWEVIETITGLQLSAQEASRVLDLCTPHERFRVRQVLGESSYERSVMVNNMTIVEDDDGWWIARKGGRREVGCSAIIRILRAAHVQEGANFYEGEIITKNGKINFKAPIDDVEKKTVDWLTETMMSGGLGPPTVQSRLSRQLITIAKQFHEPQYIQGAGGVGWNSDLQAFLFPNFGIKNGLFDELSQAMVVHSDDKVPAMNVFPVGLSEGDWDLLLRNQPENAAIWAGLACIMHNILAPVIGAQPTPVGFVGGMGSIAHITCRFLSEALGMFNAAVKTAKKPLELVREQESMHGYPCMLDLAANQNRGINHLRATDTGNFITLINEGEATALAVGDAWNFVYAPGVAPIRKSMPSIAGAMRYLAWMQGHNFELPPATSLHASVLESLKSWAESEISSVKTSVFDSAARMIRSTDSIALHRRLLQLVFWLRANHRVTLERLDFYESFKAGGLPKRKSAVLLDEEYERVYVDVQAVQKAVIAAKLPLPNLDAAMQAVSEMRTTSAVESSESGFVLLRQMFNREARKWRESRA